MHPDVARAKNVRVEFYLPPDVRDWVDRKSAAVYKSRGRYMADLLISLYRKETQSVPSIPATHSSSTPASVA